MRMMHGQTALKLCQRRVKIKLQKEIDTLLKLNAQEATYLVNTTRTRLVEVIRSSGT